MPHGMVTLATNLFHGLLGLLWVLGIRRFAGPLNPRTWSRLLAATLALPPLFTLGRWVDLPAPPEGWRLLHTERWANATLQAGIPLWSPLLLLLVGTTLLFLTQELRPAWKARQARVRARESLDSHLTSRLNALLNKLDESGIKKPRGPLPTAVCLESSRLIAALRGISRPRIVVSRGLLDRLDEPTLDAVLAHEIAHWLQGGNGTLLAVWLLRACQAMNPFSLIAFRAFLEAREIACDALAAHLTRAPELLAQALLISHGERPRLPREASIAARAQEELDQRADVASTQRRVRALLDHGANTSSGGAALLGAIILGGMLWCVG